MSRFSWLWWLSPVVLTLNILLFIALLALVPIAFLSWGKRTVKRQSSPTPKLYNKVSWVLVITGAATSWFTHFVADPDASTDRQATHTASSNVDPGSQPWRYHMVPGSNLKVSVPGQFAGNPSQQVPPGMLYLEDPTTNYVIIVSAAKKIDLRDPTVDGFAELSAEAFVKESPGAVKRDSKSLSVTGRKAVRKYISYPADHLQCLMIMEVQEYGEYLVEARYACLPSQQSAWMPTIDRISRSFTELTN
ncbi:hypothetical protein [Roseiconus lacunae]|uniref:hypothetical protein n=1 Tax=Roseiconus lacunae TaxID=2605694 RepID=UPI001E62A522|nr:hypothetical protein [Roseiconus lacunae]MCD0458629.1 hypothetical protein [Roseiconus lacunae]